MDTRDLGKGKCFASEMSFGRNEVIAERLQLTQHEAVTKPRGVEGRREKDD